MASRGRLTVKSGTSGGCGGGGAPLTAVCSKTGVHPVGRGAPRSPRVKQHPQRPTDFLISTAWKPLEHPFKAVGRRERFRDIALVCAGAGAVHGICVFPAQARPVGQARRRGTVATGASVLLLPFS